MVGVLDILVFVGWLLPSGGDKDHCSLTCRLTLFELSFLSFGGFRFETDDDERRRFRAE